MRYILLLLIVALFVNDAFSQIYGYTIQKDSIYFTLNTTDCTEVSTEEGAILEMNSLKIEYVALMADWNEWNRNLPKYKLKKQNDTKYTLIQPLNDLGEGVRNFKFLINGQYWAEPPKTATNRSPVSQGDNRYQNWLVYLPAKTTIVATRKESYSFNIHIKNLPDSSFISLKSQKMTLNSSKVGRGKAKWEGIIEVPINAYLLFSITNGMIPLILENKKYEITGVYKKNKIRRVKITGSPLTSDYKGYLKGVRKYSKKQERVSAKSQKYVSLGDSTKAIPYFVAYRKAQKRMDNNGYTFMLSHPASYFSLILFSYNWNSYSLDSAKQVYNNFKPALKQSTLGKDMALVLENSSRIKVGDEMKKFSLPDTSGKLVSLQDYKGNWIVLDFWASWCKPCMANIPKIKDLRKIYTEKDLVVIGISVDKYKEPWLNAIRKEKTDWLQLCDFRAEQGIAVSQYNVMTYPTYILINPEGKIAYLPKNIDELTSYLDTLNINQTKN